MAWHWRPAIGRVLQSILPCEEPERNKSNKLHDASSVIRTFFRIWSKQQGVINHWLRGQIGKKCPLIFSSIWILFVLISSISPTIELSLSTESENFPFFPQRVFSYIFPRVCARSTQKLALLRPTCKVNCDWSLTADVTEKSALEKSLAPRVIIAMIFFHLIIPLLPRFKLLFRHDWFDYLYRWHHLLCSLSS